MNQGVRALLYWAKAAIATDGNNETNIELEDLQNGELLLQLVYILKGESNPCPSSSVEGRFTIIADFAERDCKFVSSNGTPISWTNIIEGSNLTTEISKILLLLVYHDLMNSHRTLGNIDSDTESQIAFLTEAYVMESDGCVSLKPGLDTYLSRRYLKIDECEYKEMKTPSVSSVSSYEEESPLFERSSKVKFVDMHCVASSSHSSPIQNIMNTPKYQLRRIQRQLVEERDYRDGLERELSQRLEQLAEKESQINRLQYILDKLKKDQGFGEQIAKERFEELEIKNNQLLSRFDEVLKQNKELKGDTAAMERQMYKLTEENGDLSSQVKNMSTKLAGCQAEVGWLREIQATKEEEWTNKTWTLEMELDNAKALKVDLLEQIEILKGRISCLEDQISRSAQQEEGENMWISVEKVKLERNIYALTEELAHTTDSLQKTEVDVLEKTQKLKECEEEISHLLIQQQSEVAQLVQSKEDAIENLHMEMINESEALKQEICGLKLCLDKAEQEEREQNKRMQLQLASYTEEIEKLKETMQQKEELLFQTTEKIKDLMLQLCEANTLVADKDKKVCELTGKVDSLVIMHQQVKDEAQAKDEMLSQLLVEKSQEEKVLQSSMRLLKDQINGLQLSLKETEESLQTEKDLFSQMHQEKCGQIEVLRHDIGDFKTTIEMLKSEIQAKDDQLLEMRGEKARLSESQQEEILSLANQINGLSVSLMEAKQQVQTQQAQLTKQEEENSCQKKLLQQQLLSSEESVRSLKEEIKMKTDEMNRLENQGLEQSELVKKEMHDLQQQITCLKSQLTKAQEDLSLRDKEFVLKEQETEELQTKVTQLQDELMTLCGNLKTKGEELCQLKRNMSTEIGHLKADNQKQSQVLEDEIQSLHSQVESLQETLNNAVEQLKTKEEIITRRETEISCEKGIFQKRQTTLEEEMCALKNQVSSNENQLETLKNESSLHQQEKLGLERQLEEATASLSEAQQRFQTRMQLLTEQELKATREQELLQQKLADSHAVINKLEDEVSGKELQIAALKTRSSEQSNALMEQNDGLRRQLQSSAASLKDAEDKMLFKESLLTQQQQENKLKQQELCDLQVTMRQAEDQVVSFKEANNQLQVDLREKDALLEKSLVQCRAVESELSVIKMKMSENDKMVLKLQEDAVAQSECIHKAKGEVQEKDNLLNELREKSSQNINSLQSCVDSLKSQLRDYSQELETKERELLKIQLESSHQIDDLNRELVIFKMEVDEQKDLHTQAMRKNEAMLDTTQKEREVLVKEKETLHSKMFAVEKQLEVLASENQKLVQGKQMLERENQVAQNLHTKLQQELQTLKMEKDNILKEKGNTEDIEIVRKDFLEQLSAKSTAAEHYKAQMEKAVNHYNSKKQLLQQSEEAAAKLKESLELHEHEAKTATMENKILQMELDKIQSNEKLLLNKIAGLEAQLSYADKALREQNKIQYDRTTWQSMPSSLDKPSQHYGTNATANVRSMSSDSLDQSSAEDSLNNTRKLCAPDESSTPLIRSSERLAAKRRGLEAESLETLYFTPINKKVTTHSGLEESVRKSSASSVKRRRTTQVINITMTKKTPGRSEADDTFYSLTSARSHPNLPSVHKAQGISAELFATPAKPLGSEADQLFGLPGYRRSTIHSQATSTFSIGTENEPEGGPEDWMRIAEIQARNKACLPHLKSSYPVEFDAVRNSAMTFTDEELRTGDPTETIRRASMMPGQLLDSLASHRLSYMVGQSGAAGASRPRLTSPKGTKRAPSTLTIHPTSPEKKVRVSCFPRPLTPKNKNVCGPGVSHIQPTKSPVDRRQSMMFTIDNTPRKDLLKKGLSKLRSSTRKSPGKSSKKSPAPPSNRRGQENVPAKNSHAAVGRAGRLGSQSKGQKSPKVSSRAAKSPGLTASARKDSAPVTQEDLAMMSRMKV